MPAGKKKKAPSTFFLSTKPTDDHLKSFIMKKGFLFNAGACLVLTAATFMAGCDKQKQGTNITPSSAAQPAAARSIVIIMAKDGAYREPTKGNIVCQNANGKCYEVIVMPSSRIAETGNITGDWDISTQDGSKMTLDLNDGSGNNKHEITSLHQTLQPDGSSSVSFQ